MEFGQVTLKRLPRSLYIYFITFSSLLYTSCGVGFGADSDDYSQADPAVEYFEVSAKVSFNAASQTIKVDLDSVQERSSRPVPICSKITFENNETLAFELMDQGEVLYLSTAESASVSADSFTRFAELPEPVSIPGIPPELFAVWSLPEIQRGEIREQITLKITANEIVYRNECRQGL